MDRKNIVGFSILFLFIAACAQMDLGGKQHVDLGGEQHAEETSVTNLVKSGRIALLYSKPDEALPYFHQAAEADPSYVNDFTPLKEGVWTYLGRAYYDSRKFPEAQNALKQALERNGNDFTARLYLGLTLIQIQPTTTPPTPLSLEQILTLLRSTVAADQVGKFVIDRGISFSLNKDNEKEIRQAGAKANDPRKIDALVEQLKQPPKAPIEERPSPDGLKNLETGLKEMHDWLDQLSQKPEGKSWDPQRQIRVQIDKTLRGINNMGRQQIINAGKSIGKSLEEEIDLAQTRAPAN